VWLVEIECLRVEERRWFFWLALFLDAFLMGGVPSTGVWMRLRDGRTMTLRFDRRRTAIRIADAIEVHRE
jgi:hypothetical protein